MNDEYLIQPDYGGFNSRFLGVQLRFHASHPDVFSELMTLLGATPDQVVATGNAALQAGDARAFHVFALGSVLAHEMRHFHDFLLSPLSQAVFRWRVAGIFHGIQALPDIARQGFVPVPLPRWARLPGDEQQTRLRQWARLLQQALTAFELPATAPAMLQLAHQQFSRIQRVLQPRRVAQLQPLHLFEASALLVQYHCVRRLFGEPHARRFVATLYALDVPADYKLVLNMLGRLWDKGSAAWDMRAMSAMLLWAIAGATTVADDDDGPTIRFLRLFQLLEHDGLPTPGLPVLTWFAQWDAALGSPPLLTRLRAALAENEKLLQQVSHNQPPGDRLFRVVANGCLQAMQCLTALSRQMLADFQRAPEAYVDPAQYVDQAQFVACPWRVDFIGGGVEAERFQGSRFVPWHTVSDATEQTLVTSAYMPARGANQVVASDAILDAALTMDFGDLLFNEFSRDGGDIDAIRRALRMSLEIEPLEVF